jgi:hypothetical protein
MFSRISRLARRLSARRHAALQNCALETLESRQLLTVTSWVDDALPTGATATVRWR